MPMDPRSRYMMNHYIDPNRFLKKNSDEIKFISSCKDYCKAIANMKESPWGYNSNPMAFWHKQKQKNLGINQIKLIKFLHARYFRHGRPVYLSQRHLANLLQTESNPNPINRANITQCISRLIKRGILIRIVFMYRKCNRTIILPNIPAINQIIKHDKRLLFLGKIIGNTRGYIAVFDDIPKSFQNLSSLYKYTYVLCNLINEWGITVSNTFKEIFNLLRKALLLRNKCIPKIPPLNLQEPLLVKKPLLDRITLKIKEPLLRILEFNFKPPWNSSTKPLLPMEDRSLNTQPCLDPTCRLETARYLLQHKLIDRPEFRKPFMSLVRRTLLKDCDLDKALTPMEQNEMFGWIEHTTGVDVKKLLIRNMNTPYGIRNITSARLFEMFLKLLVNNIQLDFKFTKEIMEYWSGEFGEKYKDKVVQHKINIESNTFQMAAIGITYKVHIEGNHKKEYIYNALANLDKDYFRSIRAYRTPPLRIEYLLTNPYDKDSLNIIWANNKSEHHRNKTKCVIEHPREHEEVGKLFRSLIYGDSDFGKNVWYSNEFMIYKRLTKRLIESNEKHKRITGGAPLVFSTPEIPSVIFEYFVYYHEHNPGSVFDNVIRPSDMVKKENWVQFVLYMRNVQMVENFWASTLNGSNQD